MNHRPDATRLIEEADALAKGAGVRLREDLRLVHVQGDDRTTWLNGQITSDVRRVRPGDGLHTLAVNVRGKILADAWVLGQAEHLSLLLPRDAADTVLQSFERFIIMEDVTLVADDSARVISVQGPKSAALVEAGADEQVQRFACDELGAGGVFLIVDQARAPWLAKTLTGGALDISPAGFELARLRARVPRFGRDYDDRVYPQEAGLKALLSFNKGCYLGQEVVCTLENRGRMHRHLCALHAPGDHALAAPTPLATTGSETIGDITSSAYDPATDKTLAFGYVKSAHAHAGTRLVSASAAWTVDGLVGETT